jgi:hypothetical protein
MSDMSFLLPLATFLKEKGEIYTVRHYNYRTRTCDVEGVGRCGRRLIARIYTWEQLLPYVPLSGFSTVADWWRQINKFIQPGEDKFLFKVVVKK